MMMARGTNFSSKSGLGRAILAGFSVKISPAELTLDFGMDYNPYALY